METIHSTTDFDKKIKELETVVASQSAQITEMQLLLKFYEDQFKLAQRHRFGASSEQSPEQLRFENIFNEAEDLSDMSLPEPVIEEITYKRKKRVGKRKEDLKGLPVHRVDYELPESERICPECGEQMHDIGVTVRDELEIIPAKVIHKEHAVHAYGCENCGKTGERASIMRAPAPEPLISGSLASPSAVAQIAAQKYVNGIPLYRMEKGLAYDGVNISRQTMANWLIYCAQNYLTGIYSLMKVCLLNEKVLHADETPVQVLQEPGRAAQTKSYEWLYRTSICAEQQIVIYEYQQTRRQEYPRAFLKDFKGYIHTDGYKVYHNLPSEIVVVGCWAHVRRYWMDVYETVAENKRSGSNAECGLLFCNLLFAYEDEFRELTPEDRYRKRLEYSKPVSDEFFNWLGRLNPAPKLPLGVAVHYALSQREYLENIYLDGRLELSNNAAERAVRPFVQGRKQWLFSNTPDGAESSSIYYSIIETAKENNLNPFQYLKHILEKLPGALSSDLEELLPWSESLPDVCRVPEKTPGSKPKPSKRRKKNDPLSVALLRFRERFRKDESPEYDHSTMT